MQLKEEGKFGRVCSLTGLQKRRKRVEEGTATAALRMAGGEVAAGKHSGAPWRAQERTPGKGYSGGRSRGDVWQESRQELNGGEGRVWQNQPELYRLKYAGPLPWAPTCFKRYNPLACRVTSR
jgi:hypothetical protein